MSESSNPASVLPRRIGLFTATSIVVANMIGAGIFSTSGLMLAEVKSGSLVLFAWFLGGLIALAGALCYAELATLMPRSGGEYVYLREIYGPLPAFLTGWTSFFVGFSAPIALSAVGGAAYLRTALLPELAENSRSFFEKGIAIGVVLLFMLVHILGVRFGAGVQNTLTILKLVLLGGFILSGFAAGRGATPLGGGASPFTGEGNWPGLGVALLWVMFAYSGWNAAGYVGEEVVRPERNLPRSLAFGTLAVTFIYLAVNFQLFTAPDPAALSGEITIFDIAIRQTLGAQSGRWTSALVFFALLSSLSAYILIGPRVYFAMARDGCFFPGVSAIHPRFATPARAIAAQAGCAVVMVLSGTFTQLLTYVGFALGIFPLLATFGVIVLRVRQPNRERPYRVWGYPFTPVFFLVAMLAILAVSFHGRPKESLIALATVAAGVPAYFLFLFFQKRSRQRSRP